MWTRTKTLIEDIGLVSVSASVILISFASLAWSQLSDNPSLRTRQLSAILERSVKATLDGYQAELGKAACNPTRHLQAARTVVKHGFDIHEFHWSTGSFVTYVNTRNGYFNFEVECTGGFREITIRPVGPAGSNPKVMDMLAEILATDMFVPIKAVRIGLENCLKDGIEFDDSEYGLRFWCHSQTAKNIPVDFTHSYRVFANSLKIKDFKP